MSLWKGAWLLARQELAVSRVGLIFTLLSTLYLALITFPFMNEIAENSVSALSAIPFDFFFLTVLPCLGFSMNKTMFRLWSEDGITKSLAQLRTMPISLQQIAAGRLIVLLLILTPAIVSFFTLMYVVNGSLREMMSIGQFILYSLFWYGYCVAMSSSYIYWELGYSGRTYFIACILYIIILIPTTIVINLQGGSILITILRATQQGQWWISAAALALGAAVLLLFYRLICRRLHYRSYLS
ncbi:hypothetical protein ACFO9Q_05880 [Paenibacillus sp. GCM10023252]|uniref:hypothetical protein n=1 Tax=Paenibacillus sp. GCM10023252 TaxID=3252649 RepID=UPI003619732C